MVEVKENGKKPRSTSLWGYSSGSRLAVDWHPRWQCRVAFLHSKSLWTSIRAESLLMKFEEYEDVLKTVGKQPYGLRLRIPIASLRQWAPHLQNKSCQEPPEKSHCAGDFRLQLHVPIGSWVHAPVLLKHNIFEIFEAKLEATAVYQMASGCISA